MTTTDEPSSLISPETLLEGHALSFNDQPYLAELFANINDCSACDITIVVGAGISMNAGLASWRSLIRTMVLQIRDSTLQDMVHADESDLTRRAELILQLVKKNSPNRSDAEIVRRALYLPDRAVATQTGEMASSIARFVRTRNEEVRQSELGKEGVRLITTNFDVVLENALKDYYNADQVNSFGLRQARQWKTHLKHDGIGVLHVHGLVPPPGSGLRRRGPIILAESQFHKYGSDVRKVIYKSLEDRISIFVGLSMSDPNLVGPLYQLREAIEKKRREGRPDTSQRFALFVPPSTEDGQRNKYEASYSLEVAKFLERDLRLKTILLKSYSQLNQVLLDLTLATLESNKYVPNRADTQATLKYGRRLSRELTRIYTNIGCEKGEQEVPLGSKAERLSKSLYRALHDGPLAQLREYANSDIDGNGENFALFLWLRCRPQGRENAPYALRLVGTSAYVHREEWSLIPRQAIVKDSRIAAVSAVFEGIPRRVNLDPAPTGSQTWRGIVAHPLVVGPTVSRATVCDLPADMLTVGAVTLNSTRYVDDRDESLPKKLHRQVQGDEFSILTKLTLEQSDQIYASIVGAAAGVLYPPSSTEDVTTE